LSFCQGNRTRKMPSTTAGRVRRGRKDPHHPPRNLHAPKRFELPHLAQSGCCFSYHHLSASTICIPLEHTRDLVALRNLGFEFPSIKNNDYPRRSLAARIGRYAWHVRMMDPCIPPGPDSLA
ncbi:hypothetical protein Taro_025455, partial [Colocasia esculenta]|nr:hypothetical protein [Colocasia esculenta]